MSIPRSRLESRLTELRAQLERLREQFIATNGAIADCEYWLAEDVKSEAVEPPKE